MGWWESRVWGRECTSVNFPVTVETVELFPKCIQIKETIWSGVFLEEFKLLNVP